MKRILSIIFLIFGVMSIGKRVEAAQAALQIQQTHQEVAAKLATLLNPQTPLYNLVNAHANGTAVPANMPNFRPQVYAGILLLKLPQGQNQLFINALNAYATTPPPGVFLRATFFLGRHGYNASAWTLNKLWNGVTSTATHVSNHRVKYLMLVTLIALACASPSNNPWDHAWITSMRNNKNVVAYWEQLKNYVTSKNQYVASMQTFSVQRDVCLEHLPFDSAPVAGVSCSDALNEVIEQAKIFNENKSWYQWSRSVDPDYYAKQLVKCLACSGKVFEQCKAISGSAKIFDRILARIFSNGCN